MHGHYILVKEKYPKNGLLVHQLIMKYLSIHYVEGNVRGEKGLAIIFDTREPVLDRKTQAALIYPLLFARTHDINLPPTVPVLPSDR